MLKFNKVGIAGKEELEEEEMAILNELSMKRTDQWKDALAFFQKNSAHIEVLREDGFLEKTYFPILPFCHAITKVHIFELILTQ